MKKIFTQDFFLFLLSAAVILAFASLPNWLGKSSETDSLAFRGAYYDPADYAVHISMMRAGQQGEWLYSLRFTSEEHNPAFIRLFYILLGHVSRWLRLDPEFVYHAARWLFGLTALFAIERLFVKAFPQKSSARFAFFLAVLGGGIGWLQVVLGAPLNPIAPVDLWLIDAYILFSLSIFPAFAFTFTLMAAAFHFFLRFLENGNRLSLVLVCLAAVTCQLFNPIAFAALDLALAGAVLFDWWKNKRVGIRQGLALTLVAAVQIPLLIYNLSILSRDPTWSQFTLQNETLSPPPLFYVWGFAPFWLFAPAGVIRAIRERNPALGGFSLWVAGGFALAYLPALIQRRFLLGITIPLAALAVYGLEYLIEAFPLQALKKREKLFTFGYVVFASISSAFLILNSSLYVLTRPQALFHSRDIERAAQWLDENAAPDDFILADTPTSQIIAQKTHLKAYVGHEMETLHYADKESAMRDFFEGNAPAGWLSHTPIRWVAFGPYEAQINPRFEPGPDLVLVHQSGEVKIFRVGQ